MAPSHLRGSEADSLAGRLMSWIGASIWAAVAEPTRAMEAISDDEAGIVVILSTCSKECHKVG